MDLKTANYDFTVSSLEENGLFFNKYKKSIGIPYDDFLEEHILDSKIFKISKDGEHIGFIGILGKMATIFYIDDLYFSKAKEIFELAKSRLEIKEAFIPTTDMDFLTIALEKHEKIEIQALHFMNTDRLVRPAEYGYEKFRLAKKEDIAEIKAMANDFLDRYEQRIENKEIYVLEENSKILGLGVLVKNLIMENCMGTGMFTKESERGKGIGRSIILHLKKIVTEQGKIPVPGCWYYNIESKRTLESAGYISKSKLLKFLF